MNQSQNNNKWNPAGLETKLNEPFSDNIAPINLGSPSQRKPHPHLPPLLSPLLLSVPGCPYPSSNPPNPLTTHNNVTLVIVPLTSEHNAPKEYFTLPHTIRVEWSDWSEFGWNDMSVKTHPNFTRTWTHSDQILTKFRPVQVE